MATQKALITNVKLSANELPCAGLPLSGMSYETLRRRMLGGQRTLEEALALPMNSRQVAPEAQ